MNFARKYRPKTFEEMVGNKATIESITSVLMKKFENIPQAWLFTGDAGCGKTTAARIVADKLKCDPTAIIEYNSANTRGIETIRQIGSDSKLSPMIGNVKVFILDECHQITGTAMEALLKLLEEPPKNTFFMLATTNPEKLKKTVTSRCVSFNFSKLSPRIIIPYLKNICNKEGDEEFPDEILQAVANSCNGHMREAVKLLDMVFDMEDIDAAIEVAKTSDTSEYGEGVKEICKELLKGGCTWKTMSGIIKETNADPETVRRGILNYLTAVFLNKGGEQLAMIIECFEKNYYDSGKAGLVLSCYQAINV